MESPDGPTFAEWLYLRSRKSDSQFETVRAKLALMDRLKDQPEEDPRSLFQLDNLLASLGFSPEVSKWVWGMYKAAVTRKRKALKKIADAAR